MTTGAVPDASPQVPVRDEKEEIAAIIELIGIANVLLHLRQKLL
jgi:hypothetical protein